jgi:hypothetical protein
VCNAFAWQPPCDVFPHMLQCSLVRCRQGMQHVMFHGIQPCCCAVMLSMQVCSPRQGPRAGLCPLLKQLVAAVAT